MLVERSTSILFATLAHTSLGGCVYLRLLQPSVVRRHHPRGGAPIAFALPQSCEDVATSSFTFSELKI